MCRRDFVSRILTTHFRCDPVCNTVRELNSFTALEGRPSLRAVWRCSVSAFMGLFDHSASPKSKLQQQTEKEARKREKVELQEAKAKAKREADAKGGRRTGGKKGPLATMVL